MGSDSVTRQEVYQQLINAKNRPASSLEEYFEKDLKLATASISPASQVTTATTTTSASPSSSTSSSSPTLPSITVTIAVPSISGQLVRDLFTSTSTTSSTATAVTSTTTTTTAAALQVADHKSDPSQAVTCSSEIIYVTSSLLNQLEEYRTTVDTNCLAVVILGIRNSDPSNIQRDLALYSPHKTLLNMVRVLFFSFIILHLQTKGPRSIFCGHTYNIPFPLLSS